MPSPGPGYELTQFFHLSRDLLCIAGFDGYFKLVNPSFERVLGYSREELMSRPFLDLTHPDDVEPSRNVLARLATGEDVVAFESRMVGADGSVRRFEWNTCTMPELGVVYGIGRDVTDRTALADEQAGLRRVATLVARESSPDVVFAAVAEEVGRLLGVQTTWMFRYEDAGTATLVASWGDMTAEIAVGTRFPVEGHNISSGVLRTAAPTRIDDYADATGEAGIAAREAGVHSAVGVPIIVDGRLWGSMGAAAAEALPQGTESRLGEFTELVATAIANIEARSEITASRARIAAAADEERRRVVRDLHDGAQQRLVNTVLALKLAQQALEGDGADAPSLVGEAREQAERAIGSLRELAHGILPATLTTDGLRAGVRELASRMPVPVEVELSAGRLPAPIEATAYFVVAEALTNVAKHARATSAEVAARIQDGMLRLEIRDDGVGGARPEGRGLQGLRDRLAALDGRLQVECPTGGGTLVAAAIPIPSSGTGQ
ncbi:PAS domain S-box protein [Solirubrobacter ginsenosidimutans]|uniref:histidine kinase n=1 Tax=Solirubrobacter ginsenosidimutans TaxID=490573 RepID=A0A9X3MSI5_9ACTN|nr:PAS domain S-box protein [Solirubrobacter ginsenosidimutans]MDA0158858.1 PAS domain S-box protein [Solirubrobacter ginsenosidimutans]